MYEYVWLLPFNDSPGEPRPPRVRKLAHGPGWRLRVGDYRVLFVVDHDAHLVTVYAIGHRREVYRS